MKRKIFFSLLIVSTILFFSFWKNAVPAISEKLTLKNADSTFIITHELQQNGNSDLRSDVFIAEAKTNSSIWKLEAPLFKLIKGDVNDDGREELLVGVIKKTRFDSVSRKRLFIFKMYEGYIRPLWLGSRVSQPLEDFEFKKDGAKGIIRTIEKEENGNYLVAEYHWKGFGLEFIKYVNRNMNLTKAKQLLAT